MQRARLALLAAVIAALHVAGVAIALAGTVGAGLALTAYTLGLRHAFDADHIAAIDGTTRKLMADGRRSSSVGFFFALGHSSVVFGAAVVLAAGGRAVAAPLGGDIGVLVSGTFLVLIGVLNIAALRGGPQGGVLSRVYRRATRAVQRPWQMYPLGILFGLGFDTATEIALLVAAAGAVTGGLPLTAVVSLPLLFAAGMTLLDTLDGAFMARAYGWALDRPARARYYNLVLTALSAGVALLVGGAELAGLLWPRAAAVDLNAIGFAVVALFAFTLLLAVAVWRLGRLEERLSQ